MAAEANDQDVIKTNPEGESQDELNSILDALGKDETVVEVKPEAPSKSDDAPFKKVGNLTFKTEADYDTWALKNNGEVSRLTGELEIAKKANASNPSKETVNDVSAIRMQIKVADFFEANPDAVEHKDVIAALLRSGKATTLDDARVKALRASGIDVTEKASTEDIKNISKSGGSDGGVGAGSYNSSADVKETSDFGDLALTNRI